LVAAGGTASAADELLLQPIFKVCAPQQVLQEEGHMECQQAECAAFFKAMHPSGSFLVSNHSFFKALHPPCI